MQTADRQSIFIYIFRPTPPSQIQDDAQIDQFRFPIQPAYAYGTHVPTLLRPKVYLFAVYLVLPSFSALCHGPPLASLTLLFMAPVSLPHKALPTIRPRSCLPQLIVNL